MLDGLTIRRKALLRVIGRGHIIILQPIRLGMVVRGLITLWLSLSHSETISFAKFELVLDFDL